MSEDRERQLRDMLTYLYQGYQTAAQPLIEELVEIEARKPPKVLPVFFPMAGMPDGVLNYAKLLEDNREEIRKLFYQDIIL